jgi:hypothetical protein
MGHKWSVFIGHTITKVLAYDKDVFTDVIIDNVLAAAHSKEQLEKYVTAFTQRCRAVGATLGDEPRLTNSTVEHRGVNVNLAEKTIRLKEKFVQKFKLRVDEALRRMDVARWHGELGPDSVASGV